MNAKKLFSLLLALCLLLNVMPAFAAPTRDERTMDVTVDEKLTSLTELIVNAAIMQGSPNAPGLAKDETPSDLLVFSALAWGIKAGLLPYDGEISGQDIAPLSAEQARELYGQVFTNTAYAFPELTEEQAEAAKAGNEIWYAGGELNAAPAGQCDYGAHIYSVEFDGTDAEVQCDIFTARETEVELSAGEIPEDALVWQGNARVSLRSAPDAPFGYTVNAVSVSPFYQAGDLTQWKEFENLEMEYSVNLPAMLNETDKTAAYRVWQTADGKATLTISVVDENNSLDDAAATYQTAYPDARIIQEPEFDRFSVIREGSYVLVTTSQEAQRLYMVTFTFPAEYQAEYEFYAEIIRNSLSVWSLSNG